MSAILKSLVILATVVVGAVSAQAANSMKDSACRGEITRGGVFDCR